MSIYETIRFNHAKVAMVTEMSLAASEDSLARMVAGYNSKKSRSPDIEQLEEIAEAAKLGDITSVMKFVEAKNPQAVGKLSHHT
jgi:hypothetical protein